MEKRGPLMRKPPRVEARLKQKDGIEVDPFKSARSAGQMDAGGQAQLGFFHAADGQPLLEALRDVNDVERAQEPAFGDFDVDAVGGVGFKNAHGVRRRKDRFVGKYRQVRPLPEKPHGAQVVFAERLFEKDERDLRALEPMREIHGLRQAESLVSVGDQAPLSAPLYARPACAQNPLREKRRSVSLSAGGILS